MTSSFRRAVNRIVFVTCISAACQIVTGCVHDNQAQVQWTKTLRQLGIAPTYPPREDVFVGDIYLSSYNPNSKKTQRKFEHGDLSIGIEPRWSHVDLQKILESAYDSRYEFPATPDTYSAIVASGGTLRLLHLPRLPRPEV